MSRLKITIGGLLFVLGVAVYSWPGSPLKAFVSRALADAGSATDKNDLGYDYEFGKNGLAKDETQAVIWYRKAAEAGSPSGMFNLGRAYEHGRGGLSKGDKQAVKWY